MEQEASYKLLGQTGMTQQQLQSAALVEKTKVYDQIYLKHGIKFAALMAGVEKFDLRQDPDLVEMVQAHTVKVQQLAKQA